MRPAKSSRRGEPQGLATRLLAAERLRSVLAGAHFAPLEATQIADPRDRALANRLVTTALRRHGHLSLVIARMLERGMPARSGSFEAVLRLSLAQLLYLPEMGDHSALFLGAEALKRDSKAAHLVKLLNAVLRRVQADRESWLALEPEANLPAHLAEGWRKAYGEAAVAGFAAALLEGAPLDLTLKQPGPELVAALGATPLFADTVRVLERDRPVDAMAGYETGEWWVQDAAASIPARLVGLPAGAAVLDMCAAPGGKTAQLLKAGYRVTALDSDAERMERLRANLDRLGFAAETVVADAASWQPAMGHDAVLLDAPCSATGTFRRHPDVLVGRKAADIAGRVRLQRELIHSAVRSLKDGGVLLYCTCSLEPEEGEAQAEWIASSFEGLAPSPILSHELAGLGRALTGRGEVRTHPGMQLPAGTGTLDGFFVARFKKTS